MWEQYFIVKAIFHGEMMFNWLNYIFLAKVLIDRNDEASLRSAISRLYYGFFGIVRRYLINVKNKYYLSKIKSDVHYDVYRELKRSNNPTEKEIAEILNNLRVVRNNADYDDKEEYDLNFFKDFINKNAEDLIIAFDAIKFLKKHPNY